MSFPYEEIRIDFFYRRNLVTKGGHFLLQNYADLYFNRIFKLFNEQAIESVDVNWVFKNYAGIGIYRPDLEHAEAFITNKDVRKKHFIV